MSERFYSDQPIVVGMEVVLAGTEAHHLLHVMRRGVGDRVTLFDGKGGEFTAEIMATTRRDLTLAVLGQHEVDREAAIKIVMGIALPKGDRQKVLVEKLTELDVTRLVPLVTERSSPLPKGTGLDKLRRGVIEASKQCGRNQLMEIADPTPLADFFTGQTDAQERLIAHPGSPPISLSPLSPSTPSKTTSETNSVAIAVGPEGGFSDTEYAMALSHGWQGVGLGPRLLRIETAAIALAAIRSMGATVHSS